MRTRTVSIGLLVYVLFFLRSLYQRIFQFTNLHTGYAMELPGQEGFTIIQYNSGDEYK